MNTNIHDMCGKKSKHTVSLRRFHSYPIFFNMPVRATNKQTKKLKQPVFSKQKSFQTNKPKMRPSSTHNKIRGLVAGARYRDSHDPPSSLLGLLDKPMGSDCDTVKDFRSRFAQKRRRPNRLTLTEKLERLASETKYGMVRPMAVNRKEKGSKRKRAEMEATGLSKLASMRECQSSDEKSTEANEESESESSGESEGSSSSSDSSSESSGSDNSSQYTYETVSKTDGSDEECESEFESESEEIEGGSTERRSDSSTSSNSTGLTNRYESGYTADNSDKSGSSSESDTSVSSSEGGMSESSVPPNSAPFDFNIADFNDAATYATDLLPDIPEPSGKTQRRNSAETVADFVAGMVGEGKGKGSAVSVSQSELIEKYAASSKSSSTLSSAKPTSLTSTAVLGRIQFPSQQVRVATTDVSRRVRLAKRKEKRRKGVCCNQCGRLPAPFDSSKPGRHNLGLFYSEVCGHTFCCVCLLRLSHGDFLQRTTGKDGRDRERQPSVRCGLCDQLTAFDRRSDDPKRMKLVRLKLSETNNRETMKSLKMGRITDRSYECTGMTPAMLRKVTGNSLQFWFAQRQLRCEKSERRSEGKYETRLRNEERLRRLTELRQAYERTNELLDSPLYVWWNQLLDGLGQHIAVKRERVFLKASQLEQMD